MTAGEALASAEPTPAPALPPADAAFGSVVVPAVSPGLLAAALRPPYRSLGPPIDLVVRLCHLTI